MCLEKSFEVNSWVKNIIGSIVILNGYDIMDLKSKFTYTKIKKE